MNRILSSWLFLCCFMVFAMALIGAITRLTESGLSITEWKPVTGALPPLNETDWQKEFELYKATPEFAAQHFWMELGDFKKIYFWEWLHRLWGRLIGLVYALPLLWFWARRQLPSGTGWKFAGLLLLGLLQGFAGWFMVQSGLVDRPSVSHFRLALHLSLALLLFAGLLWLALDFRTQQKRQPVTPLVKAGWGVLALLSLTIIWGAFVAGLDAGKIYNTFPLMGDGLVPPDFGNPLTSAAGVQFIHRWLAAATVCAVIFYAVKTHCLTKVALLLAAVVLVQLGLGVMTLLSQVQLVPAVLHQAGACLLLALMIISQHHLLYRR